MNTLGYTNYYFTYTNYLKADTQNKTNNIQSLIQIKRNKISSTINSIAYYQLNRDQNKTEEELRKKHFLEKDKINAELKLDILKSEIKIDQIKKIRPVVSAT